MVLFKHKAGAFVCCVLFQNVYDVCYTILMKKLLKDTTLFVKIHVSDVVSKSFRMLNVKSSFCLSMISITSVSYTHLTLPTKRIV